ncbi:helix-turn-helix domain-containing protein [Staphylococcus ureilyticus]|uniref:helix-turn-helix domain-containing protein n=1 Tax=Staphylococcus ureilyticus TaxID=94138 RepID=UPI0021CF8025|nr:helix-turn-helix transcriptional regulator [Staphylococcus ureilyticus]UXS59871.1 helix-turn-helix transcriptional regulator [Staphylococcus ureilyticus]
MIICTLKKYMELFEVNQSYLSEETGITRPTLLSLIKNENKNIKYENIDALCNFFGIELSDLLLYSPVPIKLLLSKWNKLETKFSHDDEKDDYFVEDTHLLMYNINNVKYIFESKPDQVVINQLKEGENNQPLYMIYSCSIEKEDYEDLLRRGFNKEFFDYYNDLRDIKNSILTSLNNRFDSNLEEQDLTVEIIFSISNAPDIEEIKNDISFLPTDDLNLLEKEIKILLNKENS